MSNLIEPVLIGFCAQLSFSMSKIHTEDPLVETKTDPIIVGFFKEFAHRLKWILQEWFGRMNCGDDNLIWLKNFYYRLNAFGHKVMDQILYHFSLVRPLSEPRKKRILLYMQHIETVFDSYYKQRTKQVELELSKSWNSFKEFKTLLKLELSQIKLGGYHVPHLHLLVIAHHLLVRAHPIIKLPLTSHGWDEFKYLDWIDRHSEKEAKDLIVAALDEYAQDVTRKGEIQFCVEYPFLRALFENK